MQARLGASLSLSPLKALTLRASFPSALSLRHVSDFKSRDNDEVIRAAALEWQEAVQSPAGTPEPRFPVGAPVECRTGTSNKSWVRGVVASHRHRESNWPEGRHVPYQIHLDEEFVQGKQNALWAPADVDECVRAALRFQIGDAVECLLKEDT